MLLCEMCEGGRVVWLYLISSTAPYLSDLSFSFSSSVRAIVSYKTQHNPRKRHELSSQACGLARQR